jgi:hypothetical protein
MSDPLATMVAGVDFTNVGTDVVTVGVAAATLYVILVGVKWVLHTIRRV